MSKLLINPILSVAKSLYVGFFYFLPHDKILPLSFWLFMRKLLSGFKSIKDPLFQGRNAVACSGLDVRFLPEGLLSGDDVLGIWSLDIETLEILFIKFNEEKPKVVIECGSGISTIFLAYCASLLKDKEKNPMIISLEQSQDEIVKTMARLKKNGLDKFVQILYTPIDDGGNYLIDDSEINKKIDAKFADWLLIDGPCGPDGCRISTLPLLAPLCKKGSRWFLDDALRDGEIDALNSWSNIPGISVEGIYPTKKGLACGFLNIQ